MLPKSLTIPKHTFTYQYLAGPVETKAELEAGVSEGNCRLAIRLIVPWNHSTRKTNGCFTCTALCMLERKKIFITSGKHQSSVVARAPGTSKPFAKTISQLA
jgi:hypothetical protein